MVIYCHTVIGSLGCSIFSREVIIDFPLGRVLGETEALHFKHLASVDLIILMNRILNSPAATLGGPSYTRKGTDKIRLSHANRTCPGVS